MIGGDGETESEWNAKMCFLESKMADVVCCTALTVDDLPLQ